MKSEFKFDDENWNYENFSSLLQAHLCSDEMYMYCSKGQKFEFHAFVRFSGVFYTDFLFLFKSTTKGNSEL